MDRSPDRSRASSSLSPGVPSPAAPQLQRGAGVPPPPPPPHSAAMNLQSARGPRGAKISLSRTLSRSQRQLSREGGKEAEGGGGGSACVIALLRQTSRGNNAAQKLASLLGGGGGGGGGGGREPRVLEFQISPSTRKYFTFHSQFPSERRSMPIPPAKL